MGLNEKFFKSAGGVPVGNENFQAVTYTGTGSTQSTNSLSNQSGTINFKPDLVWIKARNVAENHFLADSIRGANKLLQSNNAAQELTTTGGAIASFDTNGFTLQSTPPNYGINLPPYTYVAWCWKAAASTTTIPASGSQISSEVRANVAAGFSIVKWTGTGGTKTVPHGLSNQPKFMFVKNINRAHHGFGYHTDINQTGYIFIDNTASSKAAWNSGRNEWANGNQVPTTDVFGVKSYTGNDSTLYSSNYLGDNYIAYCWANIAGYQKIGSYIGNRPLTKTVYTTDNGLVGGANGFRPRFLMIKDSSTSGEDWIIVDSLREGASAPTKVLYPNTNGAEDSYTVITFTSNGFTVGNTGLANTNGATIIYLAIA